MEPYETGSEHMAYLKNTIGNALKPIFRVPLRWVKSQTLKYIAQKIPKSNRANRN
jgi:hypothetical protein